MRLRLQAPAPCAHREATRSDQALPDGEALGGRGARGRDSPKQDNCRPAACERVRAPLAWGPWPNFYMDPVFRLQCWYPYISQQWASQASRFGLAGHLVPVLRT